MPTSNKKAKHLGDAIANTLIRKQKLPASKRAKELGDHGRYSERKQWHYDEQKRRVRTLEENKVIILVLSHDMEIALAQCTADSNLYGTGLSEHKLFRQTAATLRMDQK